MSNIQSFSRNHYLQQSISYIKCQFWHKKIISFSPTSDFCKKLLPKMIAIGQLDKVDDIKLGKIKELQSTLKPGGVFASFMVH